MHEMIKEAEKKFKTKRLLSTRSEKYDNNKRDFLDTTKFLLDDQSSELLFLGVGMEMVGIDFRNS